MASKKKAVIFDFNGTLSKKSGEPKKHVLKKALKDEKKEHVIVLSAESHDKKNGTEEWLRGHGLGKVELDVRPTGNKEDDSREKAHELSHISRQFDVVKAYDDKEQNVKMFNHHGIKAKEV
jgi:beta-phosphoglucomutase-like phosphatase (HAD superfamily)